MKTIPLSVNGNKYAGMYEAMVDDEWLDYLNQWSWSVYPANSGKIIYAKRSTRIGNKNITILMHRVVSQATEDFDVDHIDLNGLNNQSENLRICSRGQNNCNRGSVYNEYGHKGVSIFEGRYRARISVNHKQIFLGYFNTEKEAVAAYNEACLEYHGEYAKPNV